MRTSEDRQVEGLCSPVLQYILCSLIHLFSTNPWETLTDEAQSFQKSIFFNVGHLPEYAPSQNKQICCTSAFISLVVQLPYAVEFGLHLFFTFVSLVNNDFIGSFLFPCLPRFVLVFPGVLPWSINLYLLL